MQNKTMVKIKESINCNATLVPATKIINKSYNTIYYKPYKRPLMIALHKWYKVFKVYLSHARENARGIHDHAGPVQIKLFTI
jgi:hypothetical protein